MAASFRSFCLIVGLLTASNGYVWSLTPSSVNSENPTRSLVRPSTEIAPPNHTNRGAVSYLGRHRSSTVLSVAATTIPATSRDETLSSGSTSNQYLRWNKDDEIYKLQTAVTTFRRRKQRQDGTTSSTMNNGVYSDDDYETVELHAQLHFGDPEYFEYFNSSPDFVNQHDAVHYELLVDEALLETSTNTRQVKSAIMASPNDQSLAQDYGWVCQVDSIDYAKPNWYHADLSRQEFVHLVDNDGSGGKKGDSDSSTTPLWKLVSSSLSSQSSSSSAAAEAMSALLVGPPSLSYSTRFLKRRLFTNLFLPGDALANNLRALLWFTVPCPELSIILLDWSSLLSMQSNSVRRGSGAVDGSDTTPSGFLSKVAVPILSNLLRFNIQQIRQYLFGQVLISSPTHAEDGDEENNSWSLLVTKRNDYALDVVARYFADQSVLQKSSSTALLYGSSHCPDLHNKLVAQGYSPIKKTWRTAWAVKDQNAKDVGVNDETNKATASTLIPGLAVLLIAYLGIGAFDWVGMMGDASQSLFEQHDYLDASLIIALYLVKHVALYLGLSKFLVDWDKNKS